MLNAKYFLRDHVNVLSNQQIWLLDSLDTSVQDFIKILLQSGNTLLEDVVGKLQAFEAARGSQHMKTFHGIHSSMITQFEAFGSRQKLEHDSTRMNLHNQIVNGFQKLGACQQSEHSTTRALFITESELRIERQARLGLLESLRFPTMTHRPEAVAKAHQSTLE